MGTADRLILDVVLGGDVVEGRQATHAIRRCPVRGHCAAPSTGRAALVDPICTDAALQKKIRRRAISLGFPPGASGCRRGTTCTRAVAGGTRLLTRLRTLERGARAAGRLLGALVPSKFCLPSVRVASIGMNVTGRGTADARVVMGKQAASRARLLAMLQHCHCALVMLNC